MSNLIMFPVKNKKLFDDREERHKENTAFFLMYLFPDISEKKKVEYISLYDEKFNSEQDIHTEEQIAMRLAFASLVNNIEQVMMNTYIKAFDMVEEDASGLLHLINDKGYIVSQDYDMDVLLSCIDKGDIEQIIDNVFKEEVIDETLRDKLIRHMLLTGYDNLINRKFKDYYEHTSLMVCNFLPIDFVRSDYYYLLKWWKAGYTEDYLQRVLGPIATELTERGFPAFKKMDVVINSRKE